MVLVPEIKNPMENNPLSTSFITQCYMRCMERKNHLTLSNDNLQHLIQVIFMFVKLYEGFQFDSKQLLKAKAQHYLRIPFTFEHELLMMPSNLEQTIKEILESQTPGKMPSYSDYTVRFEQLIEAQKRFWGKS